MNLYFQAEIERLKTMIRDIADSMQLSNSEMKKIAKSVIEITREKQQPKKSLASVVQNAHDNQAMSSAQSQQSITSGSSSNILDRIEEDKSKPGPSNQL